MKTRQDPKPLSAEFIRAAMQSDNRPQPRYAADLVNDPRNYVGAGIMRDLTDHLLARGVRL